MKNNRFNSFKKYSISLKFFLLGSLLLGACDHVNHSDVPPGAKQVAPKSCAVPVVLTEAEQHFVTYIAPKYGVRSEDAAAILAQVNMRQSVVRKITRPAEQESWGAYRAALLTPQRIISGKQFIQDHTAIFTEAQQRYGVSAEMIASIIGIETMYGKYVGNYRVLDSLATLSFNYPKRAAFFQKELAEYMKLVVRNPDFINMKGSYAGACGIPQFMPSAYLDTAVSSEPGKLADLSLPDDAILSVAHYFHMNGWQPEGPVAVRVKLASNSCHRLTCDQKKPLYSVAQWQADGVQVPNNVEKTLRASVLRLKVSGGEEDWMTFHNFYVITRYNSSVNYAMAAFELSQALREKN